MGKWHTVNCPPHIVNSGREPDFSLVWTRRWPTGAGVHLIRLYLTIELGVHFDTLNTPVLTFACPRDDVVDYAVTQRNCTLLPKSRFETVVTCESSHVISGRICTPSTVASFRDIAVDFLRMHDISPPASTAELSQPQYTLPKLAPKEDPNRRATAPLAPRRTSTSPSRRAPITQAWPR